MEEFVQSSRYLTYLTVCLFVKGRIGNFESSRIKSFRISTEIATMRVLEKQVLTNGKNDNLYTGPYVIIGTCARKLPSEKSSQAVGEVLTRVGLGGRCSNIKNFARKFCSLMGEMRNGIALMHIYLTPDDESRKSKDIGQ